MSTDKKTVNWYNENANKYSGHLKTDEGVFHFGLEKPAMHSLVPDIKGKKVVSIGCGSGEDAAHLKKLGADKVVGVDISEKMIAVAKQNYSDCEFHVMNMEELQFPDGAFDFAYSSLALHYLDDFSPVMSEAYRILAPGSYFLFSHQHPLFTSKHGSEANPKELPLQGAALVWDYFQPRKVPGMVGMEVTTYHKSISDILGYAQEAGFIIDRLVEPQPTEEMERINSQEYMFFNRIPIFIIFRLQKP